MARLVLIYLTLMFVSVVCFADFQNYSQKECHVVGNTRSHIYHLPGGAFYVRMLRKNKSGDNRQCFKNEQEARVAGYRKSKR